MSDTNQDSSDTKIDNDIDAEVPEPKPKNDWVRKHNEQAAKKAEARREEALRAREAAKATDTQALEMIMQREAKDGDPLPVGTFTVEVPDITPEEFEALSREDQERLIRENYNRQRKVPPPNNLPITQQIMPEPPKSNPEPFPNWVPELTPEQRVMMEQLIPSKFAAQLERTGADVQYPGGGVREDKGEAPRFDLLFPEGVPYHDQLLTRFAVHMAKGAKKYAERNWEKFRDEEALERAKAGALRHVVQWLTDEQDGEDHAAAIMFNLMVVEKLRMELYCPECETSPGQCPKGECAGRP